MKNVIDKKLNLEKVSSTLKVTSAKSGADQKEDLYRKKVTLILISIKVSRSQKPAPTKESLRPNFHQQHPLIQTLDQGLDLYSHFTKNPFKPHPTKDIMAIGF